MPGRRAVSATQPSGVGTEMPRPLSSQTSNNGSPSPCRTVYPTVFRAPVAVEWFRLASPKLTTASASAGQRSSMPSRSARSIANATPTARGRCEAIVDVCGMIASSGLPNTLCRPPDAGSSKAPIIPSMMSRSPSSSLRPACSERAR